MMKNNNVTGCNVNSLIKGAGRYLLYTGMLLIHVCVINVTGIAHGAEVVDRIVAVVDDELVTLSELKEMMRPYEMKIRQRGYSLEDEMEMRFKVREDLINQLIDKKIREKEIRRANISISEAEVDNAIERVKQANSFTDAMLRERLGAEGVTYELYRDSVRDNLLSARLVNYEVKSKIVITDEDIDAYYKAHGEEFEGKKKEDVASYISQKLYQEKVEEKYRAWLTNLKQGAHIKIIQ